MEILRQAHKSESLYKIRGRYMKWDWFCKGIVRTKKDIRKETVKREWEKIDERNKDENKLEKPKKYGKS